FEVAVVAPERRVTGGGTPALASRQRSRLGQAAGVWRSLRQLQSMLLYERVRASQRAEVLSRSPARLKTRLVERYCAAVADWRLAAALALKICSSLQPCDSSRRHLRRE